MPRQYKTVRSVLRAWRVASQRVGAERCPGPLEAVKWMAGVQAQDYRWGRWSIGLRTEGCDEQAVERALEGRQIVRTWLFRGTLHFVAMEDLGWLRALLAPGIVRGNARRYEQLGLDDAAFASSQAVLRRALAEQGALTRAELVAYFEKEGVPAAGQQVPYLLQRAALDGVICHGGQRGPDPEYLLLEALESETGRSSDEEMDRRAALARLAARYVASHEPVTARDFAWWAGLKVGEARQGLEAAAEVVAVDGVEYWAAGEPPVSGSGESGCLLPRFDEYLMGYKERGALLDPAYAKRVNAGGGLPRPAVMVDGEIVGTWGYEEKKGVAVVTVESFKSLIAPQRQQIEHSAAHLAKYRGVTVKAEFV